MLSRDDIHAEFVGRFHVGDPPTAATEIQIDSIAAQLDTEIPKSYRSFMTRFGPIYTPHIVDAIVDSQLEHTDVQNIVPADEVIEGTKAYWSAGMPPEVIGVASDSMGNMIGFLRHSGETDDTPVIQFDHDFCEVETIADSFDAFLTWYIDNLKSR